MPGRHSPVPSDRNLHLGQKTAKKRPRCATKQAFCHENVTPRSKNSPKRPEVRDKGHMDISDDRKAIVKREDGPRQGYKFGYMPYKLTNTAINNEELTKIARDEIDRLGTSLNESAILSCIKNDKRIVLYHTVPDRDLIVRTNVDKSIYSANTGRVIIANYTPAHLEKCLIRLGLPSKEEWPGIYDSDNPQGELVNKLAAVRVAGYEIHHDTNGIVGVAAPIFKGGHVVGSVGVYMPKMRYTDEGGILKKVLDTASAINQKIELTDRTIGL